MPAVGVLAIQLGFSFAAWGVLANALAPWLRTLRRPRALELMLWTHVPRVVPLGLLAPGQVEGVAPAVKNTIAWGDFSAAALALVAIVVIRSRGERALGWVWAFTVVSCIDIVVALTTALAHGVHEHPLGAGWYVLTIYVPLVCVSQLLLGQALVRPLRSSHA